MELSPNTDSVTPCRMPLCDRPSAMSAVSEWFSMSMKPGATARPDASISERPRAPPSDADRRDAVALDRDVCGPPGRAAAVVHGPMANHDVVLGRRGTRRRQQRGGDEEAPHFTVASSAATGRIQTSRYRTGLP